MAKSNFIETYSILNKDECKRIVESFEEDERTIPGLTGVGVCPDYKKSTDLPCDFNDDDKWGSYNEVVLLPLLEAKDKYVKKYENIMSKGPAFVLDRRYNIQRYKEGEGFFSEHHEHCQYFPYRMLAWSLFLNDAECGTYFTYYDKVIPAVGGNLIIFPAFWMHMHRGVVPNKGLKYIATGWWEYERPTPPRPMNPLF